MSASKDCSFLFKQVIDGLQLFLSCFRCGLELLNDGGDVDVDGVCLCGSSVLQSCREIFQSVDLVRDEEMGL